MRVVDRGWESPLFSAADAVPGVAQDGVRLCPVHVRTDGRWHSEWLGHGVCVRIGISTPRTCRPMSTIAPTYRSRFATALFDLLNPIPYGLFVGTLIFDITYATTRNVFWGKGAAWLVMVGLFFAIIPRL